VRNYTTGTIDNTAGGLGRPSGPTGETRPSGDNLFVIPFSTGYANVSNPAINDDGESTRISGIGFGGSGVFIELNTPNGNTFRLVRCHFGQRHAGYDLYGD
jgi:hypothetical protein